VLPQVFIWTVKILLFTIEFRSSAWYEQVELEKWYSRDFDIGICRFGYFSAPNANPLYFSPTNLNES